MSILYPSPIFGPVKSRRLGTSLGVNLMPNDRKICTFDCIYCECGLNSSHTSRTKRPTTDEVKRALENRLQQFAKEGLHLDVITFAGNGEPTAHPDFSAIIDNTIALRDQYCPQAKISVLSNATLLYNKDVFAALQRVDNNIQKLDTIDHEFIQRIDRPCCKYDVNRVVEQLEKFEGNVIIQTMFLHGKVDGVEVDNTTPSYVTPWLEALQRIRPRQVQIYTIDRATPIDTLEKATPDELNAIGALLKAHGFDCTIAY